MIVVWRNVDKAERCMRDMCVFICLWCNVLMIEVIKYEPRIKGHHSHVFAIPCKYTVKPRLIYDPTHCSQLSLNNGVKQRELKDHQTSIKHIALLIEVP